LGTQIYVANAPVPLGGDLNVWAGKDAKTIPPLLLNLGVTNTRQRMQTMKVYLLIILFDMFFFAA
jgi:hypothetical protein